MNEKLQKVLVKLEGVKEQGNEYQARCPAHEDRHQSLSVSLGNDGRILIHCHAGCQFRAILDAAGLSWGDVMPERIKAQDKPKVFTTAQIKGWKGFKSLYVYEDAEGKPRFCVVRTTDKNFPQLRAVGPEQWEKGLQSVRRFLYHLPQLKKAVAAGEIVFISEGEKDVENLEALGLPATTNPGGAEKWRPEYSEYLKGADVVILPDNDDPGEKHALKVAMSLKDVARRIRVLRLPDLPSKGDVSDWLQGSGTKEELLHLAEEAPVWVPEARSDEAETDEESDPDITKSGRRPTQAEILFNRARHRVQELFIDQAGNAYALIDEGGIRKPFLIMSGNMVSGRFKSFLKRIYFEETGRIANREAIYSAAEQLEAYAVSEKRRNVYVRLGNDEEGNAYLDLCNDAYEAVKIAAEGWSIIQNPPIIFRRGSGALPLPQPQRGGGVEELKRFINIADIDFVLIKGWLIGCLKSRGPYVIMSINGQQGSAKSTSSRFLKELIDPNEVPLRSSPKEEEDLYISCLNNHIIIIDNLSKIPGNQSDVFCRISTGGGISRRTKYADQDETAFKANRPLIFNGITDIVNRGDLLDRCIPITLEPIPEGKYLPEEELNRAFNERKPYILGALLDLVSSALRNRELNPPTQTRMADFTKWVYSALPKGERDQFLSAFLERRHSSSEMLLHDDPVADGIIKLLKTADEWEGTAQKLFSALNLEHEKTYYCPKNGQSLSRYLKRIAPSLKRVYDIEISFPRYTTKGEGKILKIRKSDSNFTPELTLLTPEFCSDIFQLRSQGKSIAETMPDHTPLTPQFSGILPSVSSVTRSEKEEEKSGKNPELAHIAIHERNCGVSGVSSEAWKEVI